jgi:hypothetical protein
MPPSPPTQAVYGKTIVANRCEQSDVKRNINQLDRNDLPLLNERRAKDQLQHQQCANHKSWPKKNPENQERPDDRFTDRDAESCHINKWARKKRRGKLLHHYVCKSDQIRQTTVSVQGDTQSQCHSRKKVRKSNIKSRLVSTLILHAAIDAGLKAPKKACAGPPLPESRTKAAQPLAANQIAKARALIPFQNTRTHN